MKCQKCCGVANGDRTHDTRNHNPMLYQLSYSHHVKCLPALKKAARIGLCSPCSSARLKAQNRNQESN